MNKSLGNAIAVFSSIAPVTIGVGATVATVEGEGINRKDFESAVFAFHNAQPIGVPDAVTITCKIEESADNSDWTEITALTVAHNVTNSYSMTEISCDLTGVKKYVRSVMSTQFAGGSGPMVSVSAEAIFGMAVRYPV